MKIIEGILQIIGGKMAFTPVSASLLVLWAYQLNTGLINN